MIAQEMAVFFAKRFQSEVTVLHVSSHENLSSEIATSFMPHGEHEFEPVSPTTGQIPRGVEVHPPIEASTPAEVTREMADAYTERGERTIEDAASRFRDEKIVVQQRLVERGDPVEVILDEAEKMKYDLIILGNAEEDNDLHLGSVAKGVALGARIPVLVTREKMQVSNILVAIDGAQKTDKVLLYTDVIAKAAQAKLTLLNVQESPLFRKRTDASKELGERILSYATSKIQATKPTVKLTNGDPAKKIIETARTENCDLIVVGSHGHGSLRRLMGTVSDHVLHYADRPVLIVK